MAKTSILVEVMRSQRDAFSFHESAIESEARSFHEAERLVADLSGFGLEVEDTGPPIPMFIAESEGYESVHAEALSSLSLGGDMESSSFVVPCQIERSRLPGLMETSGIRVWPNSPLSLFQERDDDPLAFGALDSDHLFDLANSARGVDCRPFRPGVTVRTLRELLGVESIWNNGFRGQNVVVGIIDEGVNGDVYPVVGGFSRDGAARTPGSAPITSHGSMCAADVLVAAPAAKLYDYPFLGVMNSGGAIAMFQAVLEQRRIDGTPHVLNNSYGFVARPSRDDSPNHEVWDINHPLHRKVREVVAAGVSVFFAAGNCGEDCPSSSCRSSGIGPGKSIHASNSLAEVITVAAVNSRHERIGYSSQGPGGFYPEKPDVAAYSHFFGNFGDDRPGGTAQPFDNGTSAATPVAAGVGALLLSAYPGLAPTDLKANLILGAYSIGNTGWDADTGYGVINAAASYSLLSR